MTENRFVKGLVIVLIPLALTTIMGIFLFGGAAKFFELKATEYYIYSLAISCFTLFGRNGKANLGVVPAILSAIIFTIILKQNFQYKAVPIPMLILPLGLLFIGLNFLVAYFFKSELRRVAKALAFGVSATILRTLVFFITQVSFKNLEMFNLGYHLQQGAQLFLIIGVGITIGDMILAIKKEEEPDILAKVRESLKEDE